MPSSCPVCEQPIASTAVHCAVCGFPTSLAIEGLRSVDPPADVEIEGNGNSPPAAADSAPRAAPLVENGPGASSPESELNATISRDLRSKMDLVRDLGRGPDVTSELCQAALIEAEGRIAEALEILRSAQSRLDAETDQLIGRRFELLGQRRAELERSGVRFGVQSDLKRLSAAIDAGDRDGAVQILLEVERRFAQFESDWKGLEGLLGQIEGLHRDASELAFPLGEISGEIAAIHDRLKDSELTEESLDAVAQEAAQTLMLLHEAIPASLEEELKKAGDTLDRLPEEHPPAALARRLHLEAGRRMRKGRLSESLQTLRELRREIGELERSRPVVPEGPTAEPTTAPTPVESEDEMLARLLKKARMLAGRVRTLPPDSETSREAAIQIREATDYLRSRQLKEADETLSRLMRMLSTEEAVS